MEPQEAADARILSRKQCIRQHLEGVIVKWCFGSGPFSDWLKLQTDKSEEGSWLEPQSLHMLADLLSPFSTLICGQTIKLQFWSITWGQWMPFDSCPLQCPLVIWISKTWMSYEVDIPHADGICFVALLLLPFRVIMFQNQMFLENENPVNKWEDKIPKGTKTSNKCEEIGPEWVHLNFKSKRHCFYSCEYMFLSCIWNIM